MTMRECQIEIRTNTAARALMTRDVSCRRAAFTLIEMLLVLAILVAITAVTIPVVARMYDTHQIQQSAMEVRTALSAARLRAVDGGEAFECRFEPDGRNLLILARRDGGIRFGGDEDRRVTKTRRAATIHIELPEPLFFWTAETARERLAGKAVGALADQSSLGKLTWSAPIVFAPNGSSTNTEFEIRDRQGRTIQLSVRGLTGAARSSTLITRSGE